MNGCEFLCFLTWKYLTALEIYWNQLMIFEDPLHRHCKYTRYSEIAVWVLTAKATWPCCQFQDPRGRLFLHFFEGMSYDSDIGMILFDDIYYQRIFCCDDTWKCESYGWMVCCIFITYVFYKYYYCVVIAFRMIMNIIFYIRFVFFLAQTTWLGRW